MASLNPNQLMALMKQRNPRMVVEQIVQTNYQNNPLMMNLMQLGQQGNNQAVLQIVQQLFNQQGRDFNSEFQNFMSQVKSL